MEQALSGEQIRQARLKRQMTQEYLAGKAGIHRSELSLYENGEIDLSPTKLEKLQKVLARETKHTEKDEKKVRKYYRQLVGITQQSLAQQVGIDPAILSKWENGKIEVSKEVYDDIYKILDAAHDKASNTDPFYQLELKNDWAKILQRRMDNLKIQLRSAQDAVRATQETMEKVFDSCQSEISQLEAELRAHQKEAAKKEEGD